MLRDSAEAEFVYEYDVEERREAPDKASATLSAKDERVAFYKTAEWLAAKAQVIARSGNRCEHCGSEAHTVNKGGRFHIHHKVSFKVKKLRAEPSNLMLLCNICHAFIHSRANVQKLYIEGVAEPDTTTGW